MMNQEVRPEVTMTFEHRKASSDCCGAGLEAGDRITETYACRACGRPCRRVLGEPTQVTAHG